MKLGKLTDVPMKQIIGPGDVKMRQRSPNVLGLVESIPLLGGKPIHPLVCHRTSKGLEIKSGRDRYSALLLLKAKTAPVRVVLDATPLELLQLEIYENLHRRHDDRDAMINDLVERTAALIGKHEAPELAVKSPVNSGASIKSGRPLTPTGDARKLVAEAEGVSVEAVRAAQTRHAKAREEEARPAPAPEAKPSLPIEAFGRAIPAMVQIRVMVALDALGAIDKAARAAQKALSEVEAALMAGERPPWLQKLRELSHRLGAEARSFRPAYLCLACVDTDEDLPHALCKVCGGQFTITAEQYEALPPEQKHGGSEHAAGLDPDPAPAAPAFDSPEWHRANYALHGSACGCKSCNACRRKDGVPGVHPGAKVAPDAHPAAKLGAKLAKAVAAPAKKRPGIRVDLNDGNGPREIEDAQRELTVERDDDNEAWAP